MLKKIINFFRPKKQCAIQNVVSSSFPEFHIDKHYDEMNRRERREYKRWLAKHDLWDGAVVIENLEKRGRLFIGD
jgi:hypothetical protein